MELKSHSIKYSFHWTQIWFVPGPINAVKKVKILIFKHLFPFLGMISQSVF